LNENGKATASDSAEDDIGLGKEILFTGDVIEQGDRIELAKPFLWQI
jgi:hypothetical protein